MGIFVHESLVLDLPGMLPTVEKIQMKVSETERNCFGNSRIQVEIWNLGLYHTRRRRAGAGTSLRFFFFFERSFQLLFLFIFLKHP